MPNSLRTSRAGIAYYRTVERLLLPRLQIWGLTPDRLTWLGVAAAALVPLGFWIHPICGFLLILLSGMADSADGLLARRLNSASTWGAFLDSNLDRISDFFYLMGFWVMLRQDVSAAASTIALAVLVVLTLLISYSKARAEALGYDCPVGLMERGTRVIFLIVWSLLLSILSPFRVTVWWTGGLCYGALALATVLQRGWYLRQRMAEGQTQKAEPPSRHAP